MQVNVTGNGQRAEAAPKRILGLDSKGRVFQWADDLVDLVNQLSAEYESWCKVQKVPYIRMDDQDAKGYYLTQSQRAELAKFRERWNALEQAQVDSSNRSTSMKLPKYTEQGDLADKAFAEYVFGDGVMVTDTSGWEYTTPGHERTRKVYVETEREDDGPAPRWVLNFTVRFDPATGSLSEAYAMDNKGQVWGTMPSPREVPGNVSKPIEQASSATKLVEVRLSALTRVEYMEVVEVPANITQAELDDLVNARYRQVDGGEFTSDPEYWERGTCEAVDSDMPDETPTMMAFRTEHGLHIERADAASQTVDCSGPTP